MIQILEFSTQNKPVINQQHVCNQPFEVFALLLTYEGGMRSPWKNVFQNKRF